MSVPLNFVDTNLPVVGDLLPQQGPTFGAKISINGLQNIPQPTYVKYVPPVLAFKTLKGKPIYQGLPNIILHWNYMDIDGFQALAVAFFAALNTDEGPIVDLIWPNPYEAGRYVAVKAYMEWPGWDTWQELMLQGIEVTLSSVSISGQGIWF